MILMTFRLHWTETVQCQLPAAEANEPGGKRQGHVKTHEVSPRGVIKSLFQDHGFIAAGDDREVYFHRNSIAAGGFDGLSVGERVSFSEETGDKGQQATFVRLLRKHTVD